MKNCWRCLTRKIPGWPVFVLLRSMLSIAPLTRWPSRQRCQIMLRCTAPSLMPAGSGRGSSRRGPSRSMIPTRTVRRITFPSFSSITVSTPSKRIGKGVCYPAIRRGATGLLPAGSCCWKITRFRGCSCSKPSPDWG